MILLHEKLVQLKKLLELMWICSVAEVRRNGDLRDVNTRVLERRLLLLGDLWAGPGR